MQPSLLNIVQADLSCAHHASAIVALLNAYALDIMGGGVALSPFVQANLVAELQKRDTALAILAFVGQQPAGLMICIEGFSTFACQPLLNIHDVTVLPAYRSLGIARQMLAKAEQIARQRGCCKLTLEVLEGNAAARALYASCGFAGYALDPQMGNALFWQKKIEAP